MTNVIDSFRADLFSGKHAVVVGATSGIGLEIARGLAALGADVIAIGSSAKKIAALKEPNISFVRLDRMAMQLKHSAPSRRKWTFL